MVTIHERIDITMDPVRRQGDQVVFSGRLTERSTGAGAMYLEINIEVDELQARVTTDERGYFIQQFRVEQGEHLLAIDFRGSEYLDPAHFEIADFDITKRPLLLSIEVPQRVEDSDSVEVTLRATSDGAPAALNLEMYLGTLGTDTLPPLGTKRTAQDGSHTLTLDAEQLGEPGRKRIEIRFPGSINFDAATAVATFTLTTSSQLSLSVATKSYSYGDTLVARGRLLDGRGDPLPNQLVSLEISSQSVASSKTDDRGDYVIRLDTEELGSGTTILQTVFNPSQSFRSTDRSDPVTVVVGERKPVPIAFTLAAFAATGLALLSFVGLRTRPWERWRRREMPPLDNANEPSEQPIEPKTGLIQAPSKLSSTLRRAAHYDITGSIRDAVTKDLVAEAAIHLEGQGSLAALQGRFEIGDLSPGEHQVTIIAHGFVRESFSVRVPHRGELHNVHIDLMPVRERIFALYKRAARGLLPGPELWGIWTPREILDHVRRSEPKEALKQLTDFVEETFFSQRIASEEAIVVAQKMVKAVHQEQPSPMAQP